MASFVIRGMHDERLKDAALLDVCGEFLERGLGELGTWVVRILVKQRDSDEHRPSVRNAGWNCHMERRRCIRAQGSMRKPTLRVFLWLHVEQIELKVFGFVPRHAHEGILPLWNDGR